MKKMIRSLFSFFLVGLISAGVPYQAEAYVFNGYTVPDPQNVRYAVSSTAGQYASQITTYTNTWETYCSEIDVVSVSTSLTYDVYYYGNLTTANGTYAVTYLPGSYKIITFYQAFSQATTAQQNETIVHEFGHALGLSHCQTALNSYSVMRATGFNYQAYPLADDIAGIAALY